MRTKIAETDHETIWLHDDGKVQGLIHARDFLHIKGEIHGRTFFIRKASSNTALTKTEAGISAEPSWNWACSTRWRLRYWTTKRSPMSMLPPTRSGRREGGFTCLARNPR